MSKSRFRTYSSLDKAPGATVTIDRGALTFSVRPLRRKREFTLPLHVVAEMVWWRIVKAELVEKKAAKKAKRKVR